MYDNMLGDEIVGEDVAGEDIVGDDLVGDELMGDDLLGDDLVGDDLLGDDLVGDDLVGDELLGDEMGALFRRRRRRKRKVAMQRAQRRVAARDAATMRRAAALDAARRAASSKRLGAAKLVQQRAYSKGRVQSFGFASLGVQPGQTVDITARPQTLFRGTRLIVGSTIATAFVIEDIKVGRNSQFVASGGQPAEAFKDTATGDNVALDTCQPGMDITLKVTNVSGAAADFRAALFGDVVE